jgi:hypothetical protein
MTANHLSLAVGIQCKVALGGQSGGGTQLSEGAVGKWPKQLAFWDIRSLWTIF